MQLKELKIEAFPLLVISAQTFNGLTNLHKLILVNAQVFQIEANALLPMPLLDHFEIICAGDQIKIDNLFGTADMKHLTSVKVEKCNLGSSISRSTFVGLTAVNILRLAVNNITLIGEGSFDPIFQTLRILDLRSNELKSLPKGIFRGFSEGFLILKGNLWHCDCEMEHFRQDLLSSVHTRSGGNRILCKTPPALASKSIIECNNLCLADANIVVDLKKEKELEGIPANTEISYIEPEEVSIENDDLKDNESEKVPQIIEIPKNIETSGVLNEIEIANNIEPQQVLIKSEALQILNDGEPETETGSPNAQNDQNNKHKNQDIPDTECFSAIDRISSMASRICPPPLGFLNMELILKEKISHEGKSMKNLNIFGFERNKTNLKCLKLPKFGDTGKVQLAKILHQNRIYQFCSMEKDSKLITPMDCITFHSPKEAFMAAEGGILMEEKSKIITAFAVSSIFAPFVGIFFACALVKFCIHRNRKRRNNFRINNATSASVKNILLVFCAIFFSQETLKFSEFNFLQEFG